MTGFEEKLGRLLDSTVGEPPRALNADAVWARAYRQRRRLRVLMAATVAALVAVAVAVPLADGFSRKRTLTVVSGGSPAMVIVTPSGQLHNGQTVQVQLRGFPARRQVGLAECPTIRTRPNFSCSQAPAEVLLTTDGKGSAITSFTVELVPTAFVKTFGLAKCAFYCLLVAATTTGPSVTASTAISFAQPIQPPPPTRTAEPPGFGVAAASFITANQGWALGSTGCLGCAGIAVTHDAGKTWSALPSPPASLYRYYQQPSAVSNMAFASNSDGFLFGPGLYATHDGGHTWTDQHLTDIKSLTVAGDYAYALTGYQGDSPQSLYRSQLGGNSWQQFPLPAAPGLGQTFTTAAGGSTLVLMETGSAPVAITPRQVGRLWVTTDSGSSWQTRPMPCTAADGGAATLSVAYGHPQSWLVLCFNNRPQSSQEQNIELHLYGGRSWTTSIVDGGSFSGWSDLRFATTTTGYVVGPSRGGTAAPNHLYQTTDGGQSWHILNVAPQA